MWFNCPFLNDVSVKYAEYQTEFIKCPYALALFGGAVFLMLVFFGLWRHARHYDCVPTAEEPFSAVLARLDAANQRLITINEGAFDQLSEMQSITLQQIRQMHDNSLTMMQTVVQDCMETGSDDEE